MHLKQETGYKAPWEGQGVKRGVRAIEIAREFAREFTSKSKRAREGKANKLEMLIRARQL